MFTILVAIVFSVHFEVSMAYPETKAIQRLENMVTDLQESNRIQEQMFAIMTENDNLRRRMSEMSEETIQMKQDISDLWKEHKRQVQINRELTLKISELNINSRTPMDKNNGKVLDKPKRSSTLHVVRNSKINGSSFEYHYRSNTSSSTKLQLHGSESTVESKRLRRQLLPGKVSLRTTEWSSY
jgi:predicted RNase H-like nuclease (RuvC/YqgF family)